MPSYTAALAYRALFALFPFSALLVALLEILEVVDFFDWLIDRAYSTLQEQYARLGEQVIEEIQYES
jgi:membrane protein